MAVSADMLKRIMGAPDSVTAKLVAMRRTPGDGELEAGVWYSNFTRVKTEAERRGLPFFAMWTNGDLCGFCRRFTHNILAPEFLAFMKESGGLWWLGGSMDDNDEDKRSGVGFKWCIAPDGHVNYFPFMAVSAVRDGMRAVFFGSGHDYDKAKLGPEGTTAAIARMKTALAGQPAAPAQAAARQPAPRQSAPAAHPVKVNTVLHIRFNQEWDAAHIARFQAALKENGGHCACQPKSPDTMCMCKAFLEQDKPGKCHCGAFEKYAV